MSLSATLSMLPERLALFLILGATILPSLVGFFLVHRLIPVAVRRAQNDVAGFIFAGVGVIYGVLLSFVVVVVWEQYHQTSANVQAEAAVAVSLYHATGAYTGTNSESDLRPLVRSYVREVVEEEFPAMATLGSEHRSNAALRDLWKGVDALVPVSARDQVLYEELVSKLGDLYSLRAIRLHEAVEELPGAVWVALIVGAAITIGFALLLGTENVRAHMLMIGLLAGLIGVVFNVTIELDYPFSGETSIGPESFLNIADVMSGSFTSSPPKGSGPRKISSLSTQPTALMPILLP